MEYWQLLKTGIQSTFIARVPLGYLSQPEIEIAKWRDIKAIPEMRNQLGNPVT